jgi:cytochrome b561
LGLAGANLSLVAGDTRCHVVDQEQDRRQCDDLSHVVGVYVLLTLIGLHLAAILFYLLVKRENLIGAMFTGRKYVAPELQAPASNASIWLAAVIIIVVAALVAAVVNSA